MNKRNIFEHIFYEFDMYFFTFYKLQMLSILVSKDRAIWQNYFNEAWDSHFLHLRNIIDFFNGHDVRDIKVRDVLCCNFTHTVSVEGEKEWGTVTCREVINKTIDHLTKTRLEGDIWADRQRYVCNVMFKRLVIIINEFMIILDNIDNINEMYRCDIKAMQDIKKKIEKCCEKELITT